MSVKEQKAAKATLNSRSHMRGMYDYSSVDHRIYQTEKYGGPVSTRRSRILSPEEKKARADETVTPRNIRMVEKFLGGDDARTSLNDVPGTYAFAEHASHGDSAKAFSILEWRFPAAAFYEGWTDLLMSMENHHPVRTEPVKTVRVEKESIASDVPVLYKPGDTVWTVIKRPVYVDGKCPRCNGRGWNAGMAKPITCEACEGTGIGRVLSGYEFTAFQTEILSYYVKKLDVGKFDVMYELGGHGEFGTTFKHGVQKDNSFWRLQGTGIFGSKEDAEGEIAGRTAGTD